jgi:hypothetical protein
MLEFSFEWTTAVDASVLFGVSFETAAKRREFTQGYRLGRYVNPIVCPYQLCSYAYWKNVHFPFQHRYIGQGLLVLDGERPLEENFCQVYNFIMELRRESLASQP